MEAGGIEIKLRDKGTATAKTVALDALLDEVKLMRRKLGMTLETTDRDS